MGLSINKYELWATWCNNNLQPKGTNMIGKMIESAGYLTFGTSGGQELRDSIETRVERGISILAQESKTEIQAKCIRVKYGAISYQHLNLSAQAKADLCGVKVSSFYNHCKRGEKFINGLIQRGSI